MGIGGKPRLGAFTKLIKPLALVFLVAVAFSVGVRAAGTDLPLLSRFTGDTGARAEGREADLEAPKEAKGSYQIALEPLVVNLADEGGRRYLRVTVTLESSNQKVGEEMEQIGYRVRDSIIQVLRTKTVADLAPSRSEEVRKELLAAVNESFTVSKITGLYFQEFIIQ